MRKRSHGLEIIMIFIILGIMAMGEDLPNTSIAILLVYIIWELKELINAK